MRKPAMLAHFFCTQRKEDNNEIKENINGNARGDVPYVRGLFQRKHKLG